MDKIITDITEMVLGKTKAILEKDLCVQSIEICEEAHGMANAIIREHGRKKFIYVDETNLANGAKKMIPCSYWEIDRKGLIKDRIELKDENGDIYKFRLKTSLFNHLFTDVEEFPDNFQGNFLLNICVYPFIGDSKGITLIIGKDEIRARKSNEGDGELLSNEEIEDLKKIICGLQEFLTLNR